MRGRAKVTVAFLKKRFPRLRLLSDTLVEERLHEGGLQYLRRRRKTLIPKKHKLPRMNYAARVKRMHQATLDTWSYSDGTAFYQDRDEPDQESTQTASLGRSVWRRTDRKDALYHDCIGPSSYKKAQGQPVKIWGFLTQGQLHITVVPIKQSMNRWWYTWIISR